MRHLHTFIIKILAEDEPNGVWHGQISEPGSTEVWRVVFRNMDDLVQHISHRMAASHHLPRGVDGHSNANELARFDDLRSQNKEG